MATELSHHQAPSIPQDIADLPEQAVRLAAELLNESRKHESRADQANSAKFARMMDDPAGKKFTIAMADQVLRMHKPERAADRLNSLVQEFGLPKYLGFLDRCLLWTGNRFARFIPGWVMPYVKRRVRSDSSHVIISAEPQPFEQYVLRRKSDGLVINFNQLGEAVLGDREANRRLDIYQQRLRDPGINYVSVKLSSVVSQISLTGYQHTLEEIKARLRAIYRAAIEGGDERGPKFVNLDMEEYRDLHLTVDVFQSVLDEPEFEKLEAGIVLQAYLPDSFAVQQSLTQWARDRHARTGARIKIRLVKGANLAMEQVEAAIDNWPLATYHTKTESDANYKRMLEYACRPENADAVRLGIASHNLFDIAYAFLLRQRRDVAEHTEFEMLEGMANAQALEVHERTGGLVIYTPACYDAEFESAVAYLVRRFDENTQPGSFLGALFALEPGTADWEEQRSAFLDACRLAHDPSLACQPNRRQNRATENPQPLAADEPFRNVPNTDFSLPANRDWIQTVVDSWRDRKIDTLPIQIAGQEKQTEHLRDAFDPSRPGKPAYQFSRGDRDDVEVALNTAVAAQLEWEQRGIEARGAVLRKIATVFAQQRGNTIGTMMLDAGKAITQADVEVSEAIDFANYYSRSLDDPAWHAGTEMRAAGVVVVTPPWNFPYAIPAGGCLAALMAGNSVILKPASESVLTAWRLANQMWEAGVPKEVLQFLPLKDGETGKAMISDPRVAIVILTGSFETAKMFKSWRPDLRLYAETSGKNSMIITAAADLDLAVADLVHGAFGHAGQKCSATSLALVQREVYESEKFQNQLKDAASSMRVAGSWDMAADVTPVIHEPRDELLQGLTQLDDGEWWLLQPRVIDENPCLWSPGIRMGVRPGSWYHCTECFGPVLGIIPVDSFEQAIEIQNGNEFGLTGGLHSLDPDEIAVWRQRVEVGNAYVNRTTTGAIVQRQPFGGWKNSCVGPGAKAGGPNYVASMCDWNQAGLPAVYGALSGDTRIMVEHLTGLIDGDEQRGLFRAAAESYAHWWKEYFCQEHDPSQVHGETNHFRYRPRKWHLLRVTEVKGSLLPAAMAAVACKLAGVNLTVSCDSMIEWSHEFDMITGAGSVVEDNRTAVLRLAKMTNGSIRFIGPPDFDAFAPSKIGNVPVIRGQPLANGRIELLNYVREQSMTQIVHRYGNII